ncbi:MAG: hypothetical protein ABIM78_04305 [candidate division WOR-3 bacterium]
MSLLILIFSINCLDCHLKSIYDSLMQSPHRILNCLDCHISFDKYPHPEKDKICENCHTDVVVFFYRSDHFEHLNCYSCHGSHKTLSFKIYGSKIIISEKCSTCHLKEGDDYKKSIHFLSLKKGIEDAPSCIDCHSEHYILSPLKKESPVYYKNVPKTCANCHENKAITEKYGLPPKRFSTYLKSYHGLYLEEGILKSANCASCHGNHLILPAEDEKSPIHPLNLPKTCGKCHPVADIKFTQGKIHVEANREIAPYVYAVRLFYTIFISILVFGFIMHIIFDIIRYRKKRRENEK